MLQTSIPKDNVENRFYVQEYENNSGKNIYTNFPTEMDTIIRRKRLIIFVILASAVITVAAVLIWLLFTKKHGNTIENVQRVELTFWGMTESTDLIDEIVNEYTIKNPNISIKYERRPADDYNTIAEGRLKSGDPSVTPDIIEIEGYFARDMFDYLSPAPTELFTPNSLEVTFFPAARKECVRAGIVYCVPSEFNGLVLVYNKNWLDNAGVKSVPETWDDFQKTAKTLSKTKTIEEKGDHIEVVTKGGVALGTGRTSSHSSETVLLLMLQNGVPLDQPEKWIEMSDRKSEKGVTALDFYRSFYKQKIWDERMGNSLDAFLSGKVAMIMADAQDISILTSSNLSQTSNFDWRTIMPPQISGQVNFARFKVLVVPKNSAHQKDAWNFISFYTSTEIQKKIFESEKSRLYKKIPPNRDLMQEISNDPHLSGFSDIFITSTPCLIPSYETVIRKFSTSIDEGNEKDTASTTIIETVIDSIKKQTNENP